MGLEGWLLYDFRGQNPTALRALGLESRVLVRRFFYWIPVDSMPVLVVHETEAGTFAELPGEVLRYASWASLRDVLGKVVPNRGKVAMEYCAMGSNPYLSRVDAGTVELVRSYGVQVVSSGDLVQQFVARLTPGQRASHLRAADRLVAVRDAILDHVRDALRERRVITEHDVSAFAFAKLDALGLRSEGRPLVAAGSSTADPHHTSGERALAAGELFVLELWGREPGPDGTYAELGWVAVAGRTVEPAHAAAFEAVRDARDAAIELIRTRVTKGLRVLGFEVDRAVRDRLVHASTKGVLLHRTGHHLGPHVNSGDAATFDDFEIHDTRELVPGLAWSLHPALYFEAFGVRTTTSLLLDPDGLSVTTPLQTELHALLA